MSVQDIYFRPRQVEILWLLYEDGDRTLEDIGELIGISHHTVVNHLRLMKSAVGVSTTTGLVVKLFKAGWFDANPQPAIKQGDPC